MQAQRIDKMVEALQSLLDEAIRDSLAPGLAAILFTRDQILAEACAGVTDNATGAKWTFDTIWITASCTKLASSIITLNAAYDHKLDLDDHEALAKIIPELKLGSTMLTQIRSGWDENGRAITHPATRGITLRHLLTHTSGLPYPFLNALREENLPKKKRFDMKAEFKARAIPEVFAIAEPGEVWSYGVGADISVQLVHRLTGKTLYKMYEDYVFKPLGIPNDESSPYLTTDMQSRVACPHMRGRDGNWKALPLIAKPEKDITTYSPIYTTTRSWAKFLQAFLQDACPLLPSDYWPSVSNDALRAMKISVPCPIWKTADPLVSKDLDVYSRAQDGTIDNLGWTLLQTMYDRVQSVTGRQPGTLSWSGISNSHYWIDRTSGLGGILVAQTLPFADTSILELRDKVEKLAYTLNNISTRDKRSRR